MKEQEQQFHPQRKHPVVLLENSVKNLKKFEQDQGLQDMSYSEQDLQLNPESREGSESKET